MPPESAFGARTLGALQLAQPGCAVWSDPTKRRRGADDGGVGGILLAVETSPAKVDRETGEIVTPERRAFRCWNQWGPARDSRPNKYPRPQGLYVIVPEAVCGQDSIEPFDEHDVVTASRQMAAEYARAKHLLTGYQLGLLTDALNLAHAAMGGRHG